MNKLVVLLKKDLIIHKKNLLLPIWITGGLYFISLILGIIGIYRTGFKINMFEGYLYSGDHQGWIMVLNYVINAAVISFPIFLCTIMIIASSQNALNEDSRLNCELFHRSQPVSIWKISLSKYLVSIIGNWFILILIAIVMAIIVNIAIAIKFDFMFKYAFAGMFVSLITELKIGLLLGSIFFFFSAIFKDKVFWKVIGLTFGINVLVGIFNFLFGTHIPFPIKYLAELIKSTSINSEMFQNITGNDLQRVISVNWNSLIFNWNVFWQMILNAAFFVGGTLAYKFREIK